MTKTLTKTTLPVAVDGDDDADDGDVLARLDKLATEAAAAYGAWARLQRQALPHALECGRIINEALALIPHGNTKDWDGPTREEWLKKAGVPLTTAKRYQHVDEHRDLLPDDPDKLANLGIIGATEWIDLTLEENAPPWVDPTLAHLAAIKEAAGIKDEDNPFHIPEWRQAQIDDPQRALKQWKRLLGNLKKLTPGFQVYLWRVICDDGRDQGFDFAHGLHTDEYYEQTDWSLDADPTDLDMMKGPDPAPTDPDKQTPEDERCTEGASDKVIDLHPSSDGTYSAEDAEADQCQG